MPTGGMDREPGDLVRVPLAKYEVSYDSLSSNLASDRTIPGFRFRESAFKDVTKEPTQLHETDGGVSNPTKDWVRLTPRGLIRQGLIGLSTVDQSGRIISVDIKDEPTIIIERSGLVTILPEDPDNPKRQYTFNPRKSQSCRLVPIPTTEAVGASIYREEDGIVDFRIYMASEDYQPPTVEANQKGLFVSGSKIRSGFTNQIETEVIIRGPVSAALEFAEQYRIPEENVIDLNKVEKEQAAREDAIQQQQQQAA